MMTVQRRSFGLSLLIAVSTGRIVVCQDSTKDIAYVGDASRLQRLDVYFPKTVNFPTVVFVHGGSLSSEDKRDAPYPAMCAAFRVHGVGCVAIDYRLFPDTRWPAQPEDAAAAFAWTKRQVARYGGDSARVFLFGHSSGCLLASLVGTDPGYLARQGLRLRDVAGVIAMGCMLADSLDTAGVAPERARRALESDPYESMFGSVEVRNRSTPLRYALGRLPPFLVLVAEAERFQPPILSEALAFQEQARAAGNEVEIEVLWGLKHYTAIRNMASADDPTLRRVLRFVARQP